MNTPHRAKPASSRTSVAPNCSPAGPRPSARAPATSVETAIRDRAPASSRAPSMAATAATPVGRKGQALQAIADSTMAPAPSRQARTTPRPACAKASSHPNPPRA